jgi:uridylate kinase
MAGGNGKAKGKTVLLKLSGEALAPSIGETGVGISEIQTIAEQIKKISDAGVRIAIVVGGGNIIRGSAFSARNRIIQEATAHYMGMLGTVINGLAVQDCLEHLGCPTRLMSAIRMDGVCEPYIRRRCDRHLDKGRVAIIACGTGNPFVTTDTAAALRACELRADMLLKATKVDGVYSDDPKKNPHATRYETLSYQQVLEKGLKVMDMTAIGLCMDNKVPILVFNYLTPGNIERAVAGEPVGTWVGMGT